MGKKKQNEEKAPKTMKEARKQMTKEVGGKKGGKAPVSNYLKPKRKTLKQLDEALDIQRGNRMNDLDAVQYEMERENEEAKGITDTIRSIFN